MTSASAVTKPSLWLEPHEAPDPKHRYGLHITGPEQLQLGRSGSGAIGVSQDDHILWDQHVALRPGDFLLVCGGYRPTRTHELQWNLALVDCVGGLHKVDWTTIARTVRSSTLPHPIKEKALHSEWYTLAAYMSLRMGAPGSPQVGLIAQAKDAYAKLSAPQQLSFLRELLGVEGEGYVDRP